MSTTQAGAQLQVYLDRAMRMIKQGQLNEAEDACRAALEAVPGDHRPLRVLAAIDQRRGDTRRAVQRLEGIAKEHADDPAVWRQLGILYASRSDNEAAIRAFDRVLSLKPADHGVRIRLADIERQRGNADAARVHAETVLKQDPANSDAQWIVRVLQAESPEQQAMRRENEALFAQGLRAQYKRDIKRAETLYRALVKRDAENFPGLHMLGVLLVQSGRAREAIEFLRRACGVRKNDPDAWNNLAAAQTLAGDFRSAVDALRKALKLRPAFAEAYNNLGRALTMLNRYEEAARSFRRAIRVRADYFDAHANLGDLFLAQGSYADAAATYGDALKHSPGHPVVEMQRGTAFYRMGRNDDAKRCFERALARQPDFAPAHVNRAYLMLCQGDYEQGWGELEWRFKDHRFDRGPTRHLPQSRRWRGGGIADKRLLVYTEGLPGETLMLLRYLPALRARRAELILWCAPAWANVFKHCDVADRIFSSDKLPDSNSYDLFVPLMSLPQIMGTDLSSVPAPLDLSAIEPKLPQRFSSFSRLPGTKIGLIWDAPGQASYRIDHCCPAEAIRPLLKLKNARLFGFDALPADYPKVQNLHSFDGQFKTVEDMIAAVAAMDVVVGIDSTALHLAMGLGKPTWALLGAAPDWAWTQGRSRSLWYPKANLVRVAADGSWNKAFEQIAAELSR
ncbi:MAG: tetratricopeptide repeat protein [Gammaproteobacteria bacterium]